MKNQVEVESEDAVLLPDKFFSYFMVNSANCCFAYVERLLSHHEHPVLCVLPHILVHIKGCYGHIDTTRQKLHLRQDEKCIAVAFIIQCF